MDKNDLPSIRLLDPGEEDVIKYQFAGDVGQLTVEQAKEFVA